MGSLCEPKMMKVSVSKSSVIRPSADTPQTTMWLSNVDQLVKFHVPTLYIYKTSKNCGKEDVQFDANVLKLALSKILVTFYPVAGRLKQNINGRIEIECNSEGVLFMEAKTESTLDELGDFTPSVKRRPLVPRVDKEKIYSCPLMMAQVTVFKCGGIALGISILHSLVDGTSAIHFVNSWAEVARGLDMKSSPFLDRTLLRARDPPNPTFVHTEYQPSSPNKSAAVDPDDISIACFAITKDHIDILKAKCKNTHGVSSYKVLAAHVWRCVCKARGLHEDQETTISLVVDGRTRLRPPLPLEFMGNVIFYVSPILTSGDFIANSLSTTVAKIHNSLNRVDDEYIRSAIDYLELKPDVTSLGRGAHTFRCPNMGFVSWTQMPVYDADFGWGEPLYMGPAEILYEGQAFVLPTGGGKEGPLTLAISLMANHMERFQRYLFDFSE